MRAGIALDDEEYVGRSSSRRAMERAWAAKTKTTTTKKKTAWMKKKTTTTKIW